MDFFKGLGDVAPLTILPKTAAMHIVLHVTTGAGHGLTGLFFHWLPMAGMALQSLMGSIQLKMGLGVVVKPPETPTIRIVAGSALGAEAPFVFIVRFMTLHAVSGASL